MKHGKGTYIFASGDVIDATWKKDVCISGTYKYVEDKNTYKGRFKHINDQLIDVGYKVISDYIMSLQYKNEDQEYTDTNEQVRDKVYPILLGRFVHEYQKYAIQAGTNIYTNIMVWSEPWVETARNCIALQQMLHFPQAVVNIVFCEDLNIYGVY